MRLRNRRIVAVAAALVAVIAAVAPKLVDALLIGGGEVALTANFTPGIAPAQTPCLGQTFTLTGGAQVLAIEENGISEPAYIGPVDVTGSGSTPCADIVHESGTVTLSVTGNSGVSDNGVSCTNMTGNYQRVGPAVVATLAGSCTVSGQPEPVVGLVASGVFRPSNGNGVTTTITSATFNGAFAFAP